MYNKDNYREIQPRQSCITSFQVLYGIGRIKATRLNSFLLNHPVQTRFTTHFDDIMYPVGDFNMWSKIPLYAKIKLCVKARLQLKSEINCYSMYRLFQNLPTRGQRTRANGNSIKNYNPYLHLDVNMDYYQSLAIAYKQRELTNNERYDELKAYTEAQALKEKMRKEDKKVKNKKVRQDFIKNKKNK